MSSENQKLSSRVIETRPINWRKLSVLQAEDLKDISNEAMDRLKKSIMENLFTQPFYVWLDQNDTTWCLDGKHRIDALNDLAASGVLIPDELPATFIRCRNKKEASKLVLVYSSIYAKINQQGLFDFIEQYDLNFSELKQTIDLPDFSEERFEQKFDVFQVVENDEPPATVITDDMVIVLPGDLFEINGHRIMCTEFLNGEHKNLLMDGRKARILITDPPYNLPTNFFSNIKEHTDFAHAHGEMTDGQFVSFLQGIMDAGIAHTVPGAIHFIFMDWRHVWHMTEAAKATYGSPVPKQVCVWKKDIMANGSFYRSQQELCFVFSDGSSIPLWNKDIVDQGGGYKTDNEMVFVFKNGEAPHLSHLDLKDRIRTNVWNYPSAVSTANPDRGEIQSHPTPKPVAMIADAILDTTNLGEIVLDFFHGSGTTIIAAEKTGRLCYATEIEPKYVQHQLIRYLAYCKKHGKEVNFQHVNGPITIEKLLNHEGKQRAGISEESAGNLSGTT